MGATGITLVLACVLSVTTAQPEASICQSMDYRALDRELQNEHQCMILEKLQRDFEADKNSRETLLEDLVRRIDKLSKKISKLRRSKEDEREKPLKFAPALKGVPLIRDCHELLMNGITKSGVYSIKLPMGRIVNVWCDMDTDHGGWTVIQRRMDGSVNFTRPWDDYTFGFGNANSEYWLGNENLYQMTTYYNYTLRIDMYDWENGTAFAEYGIFFVSSEQTGFRLNIGQFKGTAGDALSYHNDMKFTTIDRDNDKWFLNCGAKDGAGWWYKNCGYSSLNGLYVTDTNHTITPDGIIRGIIWFHWKWMYDYSLRQTEIKIKPTLALKIEREVFPDLEDNIPMRENVPQTEVGIEEPLEEEEVEEEEEEEVEDEEEEDRDTQEDSDSLGDSLG
ncbi:microfibril-associated glycoprotein 4-like [Mizuhopecten yessoensis]|uniref:microfibril-associated glycoprotein 4-like n=1 Tax=Mizuhopecten yessoensis TaxID=6573 RepID=UPI000B45C6F2|nr:microfibril-associated glycoprotein 4-like [Mizuhopecten yessoensis]